MLWLRWWRRRAAVAVIPGFRSIREVVSFTSKQARIVRSCLNLIILYMSGDHPFSHSTALVLFFVFFSFRFSCRKWKLVGLWNEFPSKGSSVHQCYEFCKQGRDCCKVCFTQGLYSRGCKTGFSRLNARGIKATLRICGWGGKNEYRKMLGKYCIGEVVQNPVVGGDELLKSSRIEYLNAGNEDFYLVLKQRVENFFKQKKVWRKGFFLPSEHLGFFVVRTLLRWLWSWT